MTRAAAPTVPLPAAFLKPGHIAHRGLHGPGRAENSLAAFRAAVEHGYAIEMDVQPSADGHAMAFHDYDLDRLTQASGAVDGRDAAALGALSLRGGPGGVPTLRQALAEIGGRVPVLIEVKDRDGDMGPSVGPLEDAVADALAGYEGDVAVMSFNPHSVAHLARRLPNVPRGLVTSAFEARHWPDLSDATRARLRDVPDAARLGAGFVSHQGDALDMPRIAALRADGLAILCWTIRTPDEERRARVHADAVTFEGYLP